jgi:NTP pyrophosphatase (non-canonical NTP hydrolase)
MGVASVEQMLWWKFPAVCPYCMRNPHDPRTCKTTAGAKELDWSQLERVGHENRRQLPLSLKAWHEMFVNIYQPNFQSSGFERVFARFTEELGELAEAVRVFPVAPGYFLSEAADVFAWLMHLQELLVQSRTVSIDLDEAFFDAYPDRCLDCKGQVCKCPPILRTTLGRIAHEAPTSHSSFADGGALLTVDKAMSLFGPGGQTITLFGEEFDLSILRELRVGVEELLTASLKLQNESVEHRRALIDALDQLRDQVMAQRLTDEDIDAVAQAIAALPPTGKNTLINFLSGVSSGVWAAIFVQAVERIHT